MGMVRKDSLPRRDGKGLGRKNKIVLYNIGELRSRLKKAESFSRTLVSYGCQGEEVDRVRRSLAGTMHRHGGKTINNGDRGRRR